MNNCSFVSRKDPAVVISLDEMTLKHILRHFDSDIPGSKFSIESPERLLQLIVDTYPDIIRKTMSNKDGVKIVSLSFPYEIGNSNVVSLDKLTEEEYSTLRVVQRDNTMVRCVMSQRIIPTNDCQLILDDNNNVITVYPGELAPPLPNSPEIHDDYWDNHVFIEPIKE